MTRLSNLHMKALMPCFLLTEICLPRSLRNIDKSVSHLYLFLWLPVPVWVKFKDLYCLHAHYLRPDLPLPLCSTLLPEVESKEVSCRAFPGEGHFSLDCAPWSRKWTCAPSGAKSGVKEPMHRIIIISLYRSAYRVETF